MKRILTTILLILSTLAFGQCSEADKQKLMAFDKAWGEAGQRGDKAFLQNVYADDYMNTSPAGSTTTLHYLFVLEAVACESEAPPGSPMAFSASTTW